MMVKLIAILKNTYCLAFGSLYFLIILISLKMLVTVMLYTFSDPRSMIEKEIIKEYNYLKTLLDNPGTKKKTTTDGLANFESSEWPVMTLSLFCYGSRNLAFSHPELKPEIVLYMRKAIERVMTPEYYHFIISHYGNPFEEDIRDNAFYLGHVLMMLASYREVAEDDYFDPYFQKFAKSFYENYRNTENKCLESYRGLTWTSEQAVPLRALSIHDKIFKSGYSQEVDEWKKVMGERYIQDGILITALDKESGAIVEGPRAIPNTWTILFLHDILPEFCEELYINSKRHFLIKRFGFSMFKEYPGKDQFQTGDTGPIIFGAAAPPTAFAMGCAALYEDGHYFVQSSLLVDCFGIPVSFQGKKHFLIGGSIGTSAIFMLRSMMLISPVTLKGISLTQSFMPLSLISIVILFCSYRAYMLLKKMPWIMNKK